MKQYMIYESAYASRPEIVGRDGEVLIFTTVLQEFDKKNRNSRIYPLALGKNMITNEIVVDKMKRHQLYVEDQHPLSSGGTSLARQMRIEPSNSVAIITEMWFEGNLLKGRLETTCNQKGRDFRDMILFNGIIPAFSLRANGATKRAPNGDIIVEEPIQMVTYDYVVTPSHIPAVMEKITGVENRAEHLHSTLLDNHVMHESMLTESYSEKLSMLMESAEVMYDEGMITPIEHPIRDVRKGSTQIKKLSETYIYRAGDKIKETIKNGVLVESADGALTQMFTEEFIVKDIRNKILSETVLCEKLDTDKFLDRIGVRAANKYGPGGNIWAAVFAKSVTGKDSDAKPKGAVQKKFYEELLSAVKRDASIQRSIAALRKAAGSDDYDKAKVRSLKKEVKGLIQQLAKDLRVNQKTAMNEAADDEYTQFMTMLDEGFTIEETYVLEPDDTIVDDIISGLSNGTLNEDVLEELFFLKWRAKKARKKAIKLAEKQKKAEAKAEKLEAQVALKEEDDSALFESYITEVIDSVDERLAMGDESGMLNESCYEIWQPMKAYMGMTELKPRRRLSEDGIAGDIAAIPNASAQNPVPGNKEHSLENEVEKALGKDAAEEEEDDKDKKDEDKE